MKQLTSVKKLVIAYYAMTVLFTLYSCNKYAEISPAKTNGPLSSQASNSSVLIKTNVKIEIGGVIYENVDAHIKVSGYDSLDALQWAKDYNFEGPEDNVLEIAGGYDHYSIQLVNKWGINDLQSEIPGKAIQDGKADGPLPVTYVLGGSKNAKRLLSYVTSREINSPTGNIYQTDSRTAYTYNFDGSLRFVQHETFNTQTNQFEEISIDIFSHAGTAVSNIKTYLDSQLHSEFQYSYGAENKIKQILYSDGGLIWTQVSTADFNKGSLSASYSLSNGNSFSYGFDFQLKNIVRDKTIQSGQLCNQGSFTYDKNINPFRHLGYVDFNFLNWSANNKLTEDVQYMTCSYPTLIPISHEYTYDDDGYPVTKITTYKSGTGENSNSLRHTKIEFFYE